MLNNGFARKHKKPLFRNWKEAREVFNKRRNYSYRVVDRNTTLEGAYLEEGECYIVRLHGNAILKFFPDYVQVFSCSFETHTTKDRINRFLPFRFRVYAEKFTWYVFNNRKKVSYFEDGIRLYYTGKIEGGLPVSKPRKKKKESK